MTILYLSARCALRLLESPSVYDVSSDELYEVDDEGFEFLRKASEPDGNPSDETEFVSFCLNEGILTEEPISVTRPILKQAPSPSLRYLELQITNHCNLHCKHCYIGSPVQHEMSIEDIRKVLRDFEDLQGLRVLITGGEPLLHTKWSMINSMLHELSLRKILFTNGTIPIADLDRLNVDEIQVSIDGLETSNDALRGRGSYRKSMAFLRQVLEAGLTASVSTMIHKANLTDFEEMSKIFNEMGIWEWTVDVPCAEGNLKTNPDLRVSPETAGKLLSFGFGGGLHGGGAGYACGAHLMAVSPEGNCARCTFYMDKPVGTIRDGLAECWGRIKPTAIDETDCRSCEAKDECRGGCRFRATLETHALGRDLYRCALYDKM